MYPQAFKARRWEFVEEMIRENNIRLGDPEHGGVLWTNSEGAIEKHETIDLQGVSSQNTNESDLQRY